MRKGRLSRLISELRSKGGRLSLIKTFYHNLRQRLYRMPFRVAKNSIIQTQKGSKLSIPDGRLEFGFDFLLRGKTSLKMGKDARFELLGSACIGNGCRITVTDGARLILGRDVFINENSRITASTDMHIGDGTYIAWDVTIIDTDFHYIIENHRKKPNSARIRIEDQVWIGAGAIVLKGVTLGSGAVIAAGSVVTKDVPPGCLVGGNPAKIIREKIEWAL